MDTIKNKIINLYHFSLKRGASKIVKNRRDKE